MTLLCGLSNRDGSRRASRDICLDLLLYWEFMDRKIYFRKLCISEKPFIVITAVMEVIMLCNGGGSRKTVITKIEEMTPLLQILWESLMPPPTLMSNMKVLKFRFLQYFYKKILILRIIWQKDGKKLFAEKIPS